MIDQILHDFSELPDLRKMDLERWGWPKNWGLCTMGKSMSHLGVSDGTECVKHSEIVGEDDIIEHIYPIPDNILFLMRDQKTRGRAEAQAKMKQALGL